MGATIWQSFVLGAVAALFLKSAVAILRQAFEELRQQRNGIVPAAGQ